MASFQRKSKSEIQPYQNYFKITKFYGYNNYKQMINISQQKRNRQHTHINVCVKSGLICGSKHLHKY